MSKTDQILRFVALLAVAAGGCVGSVPSTPSAGDGGPDDVAPGGAAGAGADYDHPSTLDIWELLERLAEEGPPRYTARVHSCPKMRYQTIGRVLASRGVDLASITELSAGKMWRESDGSLGAAVFGARQRENLELTTASAARLFDIFLQAAPAMIAASPTSAACGVPIFADDGSCDRDGLTCLLGAPATEAHVGLCDEIVGRASTPDKGRVIAVAAIAAAGHTCE